MRRSGNPIYHDDPDWYERPGETVELHVQQKPILLPMSQLPYKDYGPTPQPTTEAKAFPWATRAAFTPTEREQVDQGTKTIDKDHPLWDEALSAYQQGKAAWQSWLDAHPNLT